MSSSFLKIDKEVALTISYGRLFQKLIVRTPKKLEQALRQVKGLYSLLSLGPSCNVLLFTLCIVLSRTFVVSMSNRYHSMNAE